MIAALGALTLAATAARARRLGSGSTASGRAVVVVDTPSLPSGEAHAARAAGTRRSVSSEILGRVADRDDLAVESAVPEIGLLGVEVGPGGLPALKRELAGDPRVGRSDPTRRCSFAIRRTTLPSPTRCPRAQRGLRLSGT